MIVLVRVDDRLLHGQVICAWVPFTGADTLVAVSDENASGSLAGAIIDSCPEEGLRVEAKNIRDAARDIDSEEFRALRVMLVVDSLKDAMRLYDAGLKFSSLNIGNVHHPDGGGRTISPSVTLDREDDEIIERFLFLGVNVEIRALPARQPVPYEKRTP